MSNALFNSLSPREQEVAVEVSSGKTNKEVAKKLFVVEKTVKFHLTTIFKKLQVKSRSQLIVVSMRDGWGWKPEPAQIANKFPARQIPTEMAAQSAIDLPSGVDPEL